MSSHDLMVILLVILPATALLYVVLLCTTESEPTAITLLPADIAAEIVRDNPSLKPKRPRKPRSAASRRKRST